MSLVHLQATVLIAHRKFISGIRMNGFFAINLLGFSKIIQNLLEKI